MPNEESRIRIRISTGELERRWKAVRQEMKEKNLDFLVMQSHTDILGGYVRWFTDLPAIHNYTVTLIFAREEGMTMISHGGNPPAKPSPPEWAARGLKNRISLPFLPSLNYSNDLMAEKAVKELTKHKNSRIGFVGMGFITAALYTYLMKHLPGTKFEDATDLVDDLKAIKSDEEIKYLKEVCANQDAAFEYALTCIKPGRRDYEVCEDVRHKCMELGGEQTNIMGSSAPPGTPLKMMPVFFCNKVIQEGDQFNLLIESSGTSGLWTEISRMMCLGEVTSELEEHFAMCQEAQKLSLNLLKPGASPGDIWDANNEFMKKRGLTEETRIFAHGMGYDMVERPCIAQEETMKIKARMNLAIHPSVVSEKAAGLVCDNYIISEKGENICLHKTPQKIFEV